LSFFLVLLLTSVTFSWIVGYFIVKPRLANVKFGMPEIYQSSIAVPVSADTQPSLVALCVDLSRKEHCSIPFEELTQRERKLVLHTLAIEALPQWMSRFAAVSLWPAERAVISQLRKVHLSRPEKPPMHFGEIRRQQQLRSGSET
jgi:hypothetical protein